MFKLPRKNALRSKKVYRGDQCLNCSTPLETIDIYCYRCGQLNSTKKLSLSDFFKEYLSSIFSYDSRLWNSIATLLFRPGVISKEYIEGKRMKYVNPFRFYLSVSIIFFLISAFSIPQESWFRDFSRGFEGGITETTKTNTLKLKQVIDSLKQIENPISISNKMILLNTLTIKDSVDLKEPVFYTERQLDSMNMIKSTIRRLEMYYEYYKATNELIPYKALANLGHEQNNFNRYVYNRTIKLSGINRTADLIEYVFDKLPLTLFFFLPLFALGIWLLYVRRPFTYMEHLIFTFHTQTAFFIFLGIPILIDRLFGTSLFQEYILVLFLVYLFLAMRKFYSQGWFKTFFKFFFANILFFILTVIGSICMILVSIFIY